jgi:hypothetical protein
MKLRFPLRKAPELLERILKHLQESDGHSIIRSKRVRYFTIVALFIVICSLLASYLKGNWHAPSLITLLLEGSDKLASLLASHLYHVLAAFLIASIIAWVVLRRRHKKKIIPLFLSSVSRSLWPFCRLVVIPLVLYVLYFLYRAGDINALNASGLSWNDVPNLISAHLLKALPIFLLWWIIAWLWRQQGYWKWGMYFILLLIVKAMLPSPGSFSIKGSSPSFEVIKVPESFKMPPNAVEVYCGGVAVTRSGDLGTKVVVNTGEYYAIETSGGLEQNVITLLVREKLKKNKKRVKLAWPYRVSWDAKAYIYPYEVPQNKKDTPCYYDAPIGGLIVSIQHQNGTTFAYAPGMLPGKKVVVLRALRSGALKAKYNLLVETGISGALGIHQYSEMYMSRAQGGVSETNLFMRVFRLPENALAKYNIR